ncbi:glycosyltransferase family 2 protein, partial [Mycobacterium kansasii]
RSLYIEEAETNSRRSHAPTRTSLNIAGESEVSFATYFNAFPASYWRRWTVLQDVVLRIELKGTARVDLYRSKVDGARIALGGGLVQTDATGYGVAEFATDLGPFE